jgi:hypothetical protein
MFQDTKQRLDIIINESWQILFHRIISKKQKINKEASLQLQFARILNDLGNLYCILPDETFHIELETKHNNKNIDITCQIGQTKVAIELKCFIKSSNRAKDTDMYDALADIESLEKHIDFELKYFFCLTDDEYYPERNQKGMAKSVSLKNGTIYRANHEIVPSWAGKWNVKRNKPIIFKSDIYCNWVSNENWHYWQINL